MLSLIAIIKNNLSSSATLQYDPCRFGMFVDVGTQKDGLVVRLNWHNLWEMKYAALLEIISIIKIIFILAHKRCLKGLFYSRFKISFCRRSGYRCVGEVRRWR